MADGDISSKDEAMSLAEQLSSDLVERVATLLVDWIDNRAGRKDAARAIIPLVQQAERADVVKWLREYDENGSLVREIAQNIADAIVRGEYKQESQP